MSTWKLPRKGKKAFIAKYGRGAYHSLAYLSTRSFEGVVEVSGNAVHGPLYISVDTAGGAVGSVAVISRVIGKTLHVIDQVVLGKKTEPSYYDIPTNIAASAWMDLANGIPRFMGDRLANAFRIDPAEHFLSPVMRKVMPQILEHHTETDPLRKLELSAEICGTIEREAKRPDVPTDAVGFVLVDRTPVGIDDMLAFHTWQTLTDRHQFYDELPGGVIVSTVFLGIDLGVVTSAFFETKVLGGEHDDHEVRSATWEEAEQAHREAVAMNFEA